ncbi:protein serine/threonine phosphatase 2C [Penicillium alfredii]|uniref:Protein serine/threonine phosphatase 2C n=1 Tax=Penicillium alfredii TaxID=1506179 RepID=A0A9W9JWV0_9EURO|nr:protein serine/threonine phosphatase 2C [Penicillium alfredii]KAJ5084538.1 protein serine/threonine phosphatase 2C [Penicillium alfredii]
MATDGICQQAVNLVGKWVESELAEINPGSSEPKSEPFDFGQFWKGVSWRFVEERTAVQDKMLLYTWCATPLVEIIMSWWQGG